VISISCVFRYRRIFSRDIVKPRSKKRMEGIGTHERMPTTCFLSPTASGTPQLPYSETLAKSIHASGNTQNLTLATAPGFLVFGPAWPDDASLLASSRQAQLYLSRQRWAKTIHAPSGLRMMMMCRTGTRCLSARLCSAVVACGWKTTGKLK
jgi:hypothetical protein